MATQISIDDSFMSATLIFDIKEEQQNDANYVLMRLFYTGSQEGAAKEGITQLTNEKGKSFKLEKFIDLPVLLIDKDKNMNADKRGEESYKSKIKKEEKELEFNSKQKEEVKCLCTHGVCKPKESQCWKCNLGWTGTLCDIRADDSNINRGAGAIYDGSRMNRDRSGPGSE